MVHISRLRVPVLGFTAFSSPSTHDDSDCMIHRRIEMQEARVGFIWCSHAILLGKSQPYSIVSGVLSSTHSSTTASFSILLSRKVPETSQMRATQLVQPKPAETSFRKSTGKINVPQRFSVNVKSGISWSDFLCVILGPACTLNLQSRVGVYISISHTRNKVIVVVVYWLHSWL